jgi:hypothetical protein
MLFWVENNIFLWMSILANKFKKRCFFLSITISRGTPIENPWSKLVRLSFFFYRYGRVTTRDSQNRLLPPWRKTLLTWSWTNTGICERVTTSTDGAHRKISPGTTPKTCPFGFNLLGYSSVQSRWSRPKFQRCVLPPSSGIALIKLIARMSFHQERSKCVFF